MEVSSRSLHCEMATMEFTARLHHGPTMPSSALPLSTLPMLLSPAVVARSSGCRSAASASFQRDDLFASCHPGWRSPSWLHLSIGVRTLQVLTRHDCPEL